MGESPTWIICGGLAAVGNCHEFLWLNYCKSSGLMFEKAKVPKTNSFNGVSDLEGLVVLILIIAGVYLAFGRKPRSRQGARRSRPVQKPVASKPRTYATKSQPRFDAQTARHLRVHKTLKGYARIVDGDTIVIRRTQIRLFGIDAPEINHPFGQKAKWTLVALCKGHQVRAEILETDAYDRTVARCFLPDGQDLSAMMVQQGMAIDWPKFSGGKYSSFEVTGVRKKLWLADARQKGRMHVWQQFEARQKEKSENRRR